MKTTVTIADELHRRAKRCAQRTGRSLRSLIEEGLRRVLEEAERPPPYELPDCSVGDPRDPNPLAGWRAHDIRRAAYERK